MNIEKKLRFCADKIAQFISDWFIFFILFVILMILRYPGITASDILTLVSIVVAVITYVDSHKKKSLDSLIIEFNRSYQDYIKIKNNKTEEEANEYFLNLLEYIAMKILRSDVYEKDSKEYFYDIFREILDDKKLRNIVVNDYPMICKVAKRWNMDCRSNSLTPKKLKSS